jgi:hypothetical protein
MVQGYSAFQLLYTGIRITIQGLAFGEKAVEFLDVAPKWGSRVDADRFSCRNQRF